MKDYFKKIANHLFNSLQNGEILLLNLDAEKTDFVRFNHAKIRQAGNVRQVTITLNLLFKRKTLTSAIRLSTDFEKDSLLLLRTLYYLRREIPELSPDPYLMYERNINSFENDIENTKLDNYAMTENIIDSCSAFDMVGILSSGTITKGFASSLGQFNWHESDSFNFDWSMYTETGKAIKQ
ncbi:MAG: hypothetical protein HN490_01445, partial [Gammaproteobacteria bacterium]|nr:hypothetical protein [Gammaproteobacteria bacterium]